MELSLALGSAIGPAIAGILQEVCKIVHNKVHNKSYTVYYNDTAISIVILISFMQVGGFILPFLVVGGCIIVLMLVLMVLVQSSGMVLHITTRSCERSQIPWAYFPKVVRTNEIMRSVIITQHFPYNSKMFKSLLKYLYLF